MDTKHGNLSIDLERPRKSRKEKIEKMRRNIRMRLLVKRLMKNVDAETAEELDFLIARL